MKLGMFEPGPDRSKHAPRRGFALVEIVTGMLILGVVVVALYAALASAFTTVNLERDNLRATQIMIEKMEVVRMFAWEEIRDSALWPKLLHRVCRSGRRHQRGGTRRRVQWPNPTHGRPLRCGLR